MQRSPEVVTANSTSRRQVGLVISFLIAAGLVAAPLVTTSESQAAEADVSAAVAAPEAAPQLAEEVTHKAKKLESPDGDCFEWKYPNKPECGSLAGKTECKAEPSINTLEKDEAKRKACGVEEGAECFCGEDDEDDDDDDE
ncbi:MAG: hypothetical protein H6718_18885 [Polyangiaceae bacterium]|nr:hypothetical protein [Myxococcales bacterium]MCB9587474.1 hypothetical protein [Polyangiaceae bacterium]MCB9605729.1 hypothetical protein [Polyangiaceae bacterium]